MLLLKGGFGYLPVGSSNGCVFGDDIELWATPGIVAARLIPRSPTTCRQRVDFHDAHGVLLFLAAADCSKRRKALREGLPAVVITPT